VAQSKNRSSGLTGSGFLGKVAWALKRNVLRFK
jgi:hypothetical protein